MNVQWEQGLFYANLAAHGLLLLGAVWCIAFPARRIYPMAKKGAFYYAMWLLFYFAFLSNPVLAIVHWNTGPWTSAWRFVIGGPLVVLGGAFVTWGMATLGLKNTSGLRDGFVTRGPYLFSRNPQYVGDIFIFAGVSIIANSEVALATHFLTSLVFVLAPLTEEPWLEEQYGEPYEDYRRRVPRFL